MYGNYCGPYWSDGAFQSSVIGTKTPVDAFDDSCMRHDANYARGRGLKKADQDFYAENIGQGPLRSAAAIVVGLQGLLRPADKYSPNSIEPEFVSPNERMNKNQKNKTQNLRGSRGSNTVTRQERLSTRNDVVYAAPMSVATRRTGKSPQINYSKDVVRIKHRSFLGSVNNALNYEVASYPLNPGMSSTFPWLYKLARRYEEYRFRNLRFEYRSVAPTSVGGVVMMSFDYDAADSAPTTKSAQAQTVPNSECNAWMNNDLIVPCDSGFQYIRSGGLSANLDIKTYDMGQLFLSSVYGNNITSGELYIEYDVELRKPTDGVETGGTITAASPSQPAPLGTPSSAVYSGSALPFTITSSTQLTCVQSGEYLIGWIIQGTGVGGYILPTIISGASGSAVAMSATSNSTTSCLLLFKVRAQSGDVLSVSVPATTVTSSVMRIGSAPYAFV